MGVGEVVGDGDKWQIGEKFCRLIY